MTRDQANWAVAMVHQACIACGAKVENSEQIIIPRVLTKSVADKVEAMDRKAIGWGFCSECTKAKDMGAIFLVECDPKRTPIKNDRVQPEDAYRTGRVFGITEEAFTRIFNVPVPPGRLVFIEPQVTDELGLDKIEPIIPRVDRGGEAQHADESR